MNHKKLIIFIWVFTLIMLTSLLASINMAWMKISFLDGKTDSINPIAIGILYEKVAWLEEQVLTEEEGGNYVESTHERFEKGIEKGLKER